MVRPNLLNNTQHKGDEAMLSITLNGEPHKLPAGSTLADLVDRLMLAQKRFAIEVNENIIPRNEHTSYLIQNNDQIEIVEAIGGG